MLADTSPTAALVSACRDCAFFEDKCLGSGVEHSVLEIPGLHHTKLKRLSASGIIDLAKVPDDLNLNERQERAKCAALSGNTVVEPGLGVFLQSSIKWPCHYLDFETVSTALPLYPGHGCHRHVLTQFSIHHRDRPDAALRHSEYLADASRDSERELAEQLIAQLGDHGSIMMYSTFERDRIELLLRAFPDLSTPLRAILGRLIDLRVIIEEYVCHPRFHGSLSIKQVLPALVPELSYKGLVIANGDMAIMRFARMARGEISGDAVEASRRDLLDYCKLDTLAMVRIHEALIGLSAARRAGSA